MGWNFRKSIKMGPARVSLSKSGVGYSVGAGGLRYTKRAGRKSKKKDGGFIVGLLKMSFWVILFSAVVYLIDHCWKWILGIAAVAVVALIAYLIYVKKQTQVKSHDDGYINEENNPAP